MSHHGSPLSGRNLICVVDIKFNYKLLCLAGSPLKVTPIDRLLLCMPDSVRVCRCVFVCVGRLSVKFESGETDTEKSPTDTSQSAFRAGL